MKAGVEGFYGVEHRFNSSAACMASIGNNDSIATAPSDPGSLALLRAAIVLLLEAGKETALDGLRARFTARWIKCPVW